LFYKLDYYLLIYMSQRNDLYPYGEIIGSSENVLVEF